MIMKSLFEQMGGTYTQQGDFFLPDLKLPPEEERPVGVWGRRRLRYLREHRPILYTNLKTTGQLRSLQMSSTFLHCMVSTF